MDEMWDYAQMSKEASLVGGPEKYIQIIHDSGYNEGVKDCYPEAHRDGVKDTVVVESLGTLLVAFGLFIVNRLSQRRAERLKKQYVSEEEAKEAEVELLEHLNEGQRIEPEYKEADAASEDSESQQEDI